MKNIYFSSDKSSLCSDTLLYVGEAGYFQFSLRPNCHNGHSRTIIEYNSKMQLKASHTAHTANAGKNYHSQNTIILGRPCYDHDHDHDKDKDEESGNYHPLFIMLFKLDWLVAIMGFGGSMTET